MAFARPPIRVLGLLDGGRRFCAPAAGHRVRLHSAADGAVLDELPAGDSPVTAVAAAPDESTFAVGHADGIVRIVDPSGESGRLEAHTGEVTALAWPSSGRLYSAARDGALAAWDPATGELRVWRDVPGDGIGDLALGPGGVALATAGADGVLRTWTDGLEEVWASLPAGAALEQVVFLGASGLPAAGAADGTVTIRAPGTDAPVITHRDHGQGPRAAPAVRGLAASGDGEILVSGGADGLVVVRRARGEGPPMARLHAHAPVASVALESAEGIVFVGTEDGQVIAWTLGRLGSRRVLVAAPPTGSFRGAAAPILPRGLVFGEDDYGMWQSHAAPPPPSPEPAPAPEREPPLPRELEPEPDPEPEPEPDRSPEPEPEPEPARPLAAPLEAVRFTVYRPKTVRPRVWYPMLAFAHPSEPVAEDEPDPIEEVRARAKAAFGRKGAEAEPPGPADREPEADELAFVPEVRGLEFDPPRRVFRWNEPVHGEEFRLRAAPEMDGRIAAGRVAVLWGERVLAEVALRIPVSDTPHEGPRVPAVAETARAAPAEPAAPRAALRRRHVRRTVLLILIALALAALAMVVLAFVMGR